jgi:hypothetical protein
VWSDLRPNDAIHRFVVALNKVGIDTSVDSLWGSCSQTFQQIKVKGDAKDMQDTTIRRRREGNAKSGQGGAKPLTNIEQQAKENGSRWLQLAKEYVRRGDRDNAVSCCLEGLWLVLGVSRPLAVKDQLQDLLDAIDPTGESANWIRKSISTAAKSMAPQLCAPCARSASGVRMEHANMQYQNAPMVFVPRAEPNASRTPMRQCSAVCRCS